MKDAFLYKVKGGVKNPNDQSPVVRLCSKIDDKGNWLVEDPDGLNMRFEHIKNLKKMSYREAKESGLLRSRQEMDRAWVANQRKNNW